MALQAKALNKLQPDLSDCFLDDEYLNTDDLVHLIQGKPLSYWNPQDSWLGISLEPKTLLDSVSTNGE